MRRPDVFTLDYSHPLAQGLVFAGLADQGVVGNGAPYYDASVTRQPALGVGTSGSEFLSEINRHAQVFNSANQNAIDLGDGLPYTGPFTFGLWVWTNSVNSQAFSSRTTPTELGFELLTGNGGNRGQWLWRSSGNSNTAIMTVDDNIAHHCAFVLAKISASWVIQTYLDGSLFSQQSASSTNLGQTQNPHLAKRLTTFWTGKIADPVFYNRALSPAEIALLADRTDPMLGGLVREVNPVAYFDFGGASAGTDNLTATDLVTGSPALGTPALDQVHALTATGITTSATVLGSPALGQVHGLTATALVVGSPVLGTPTLTENAADVDALTANDLVVSSPVLGTPAIWQIHVLGSDGLVTGAPVLGSPSITQIHTLDALGLTVGVPVLGTPALNGSDIVLIDASEVGRAITLQARNYRATLAKRNYTARL